MSDLIDQETVRRRAEAFSAGVEAQSGRALGFDVRSLGELDALLAEWLDLASVYDTTSAFSLEALAVPIASYVGEVLVRTDGAAWLPAASDVAEFPLLRLRTGQQLDLIAAVSAVLRGSAPPAFQQLPVIGDTRQAPSSAGSR